ncbi:hypothetical protein HHL19_33195 [Streptomyces sp. R302]|uniref:hypothetical protein n=1 Tax=unclassified Streptomyces TaxID=2593676 RepID=UPI00145F83D6|nr:MULTISPECIES: hypothetical protein [unclassified Streptomyces]NML54111.1 hypothetical protein [Streptomyces sp. R301]NML83371.1 hypothetical protein [Streptomyces sp. R302]
MLETLSRTNRLQDDLVKAGHPQDRHDGRDAARARGRPHDRTAALAPRAPSDLADALLICTTGNAVVGRGTTPLSLRSMARVAAFETLTGKPHSGMLGGTIPDALAAPAALVAQGCRR